MSKLTYGLGFALGTIAREFLSTVKKTSAASTAALSQAPNQGLLPLPCVPDHVVREMDHLPAMARKGVDLNLWYTANTREVQKPSRKRRTKATAGSMAPATC